MKIGRSSLVALGIAVALTACGGGGDDSSTPPAPPGPPSNIDRIEPLDTAALARQPAKRAPAVATASPSRLPAGAVVEQVTLPPLALPKAAAPADKGIALEIGTGRDVAMTETGDQLARYLHWQTLPDGAQVAALTFAAPGAAGLRLGIDARQLPEGTVLRFSGGEGAGAVAIPATEVRNVLDLNAHAPVSLTSDAQLYWSPVIDGAAATLEIELPAGIVPAELQLAVPRVSQLTQSVADAIANEKSLAEVGDSASCNVNVMCVSGVDQESRSVAKIVFTDGGATFLCTGTLMNDTRNSQTPYFLTAAHCISNQPAASSVITYWFFRAAACGADSGFDRRITQVNGGGELLRADGATDATLLRLRAAPPADVVYAGSYFGTGVGPDAAVIDISNPSGDLQKISLGAIRDYYNCPLGDGVCSGSNAGSGNMFRVTWSRGTTEGGSSGSALFATLGNTRYVVGALHGGNASCLNPNGSDFFGRFERSFATGLGAWLAPN